MKKTVYILPLYFFLIFLECCNNPRSWEDDRLCETPENEVVLEELIDCCKAHELKAIRSGLDTSLFFVSFIVFNQNDTNKVWVMDDFSNPVFLHDSMLWGINNFFGFFKKNNSYCFFYKYVFSNQTDIKEAPRVSSLK